ncbi:MAG: hypothetical protein KDD36_09310 [Flavobacteriales bacterium]|nr:hypothetical protein [Flavobacteriales bacterium]
MKTKLTYFTTGIILTLAVWLLFLKGCYHQEPERITRTDTVYVNKPYKEVKVKYVEKSVKVLVYKTDTVYRKRIEKDTLITSVEITSKLAKIHTITPAGLPVINEYPLPEFREIRMDHQGNMQVKKKKHRRFWRVMEKVGLFAGGIMIGRKFLPDK